jgi:hypothetical protein
MSDQLHVFAIGNDTAMWTRVFDGSTWTGDWASLGGSFASQPSTIVWAKGSRMNVFGIDSATSQVVTKDYQDGKWADSWLLMNRSGSTAIAGCNVVQENDRADVFTRSMSTRANIVHNWWVDAVNKWRGQDYPWDPTSGGTSKSTPAIVCRDDPTYHDLVIYDQASGSVMHDQWSKNYMAWLGWNNRGGSFAGNPVLVSPSNSRVDFFGTGTDSQIYHFSWDTKSGYSQLETLGGNFSSMPSVVVTTPERLDVVAVGTDDMLKHRALIGSTWTASWEDLGVFANSAPMAIACGDQAKRRVGVFIIGKKNEAMYASWSASNSSSWKGLARFGSIGGNLTTKWMWEVY